MLAPAGRYTTIGCAVWQNKNTDVLQYCAENIEPRGETETILFSHVLNGQEREEGKLGFLEILSHKMTAGVASLVPNYLYTSNPNFVTLNSSQIRVTLTPTQPATSSHRIGDYLPILWDDN